MAQLNTRRTYASFATPLQNDFDLFLNDIETFFNITKLNNDNIQDASITASSKISPLSITTSKLKNDSITTAKINDLAVTTAKIEDGAVTTAKLASSSVLDEHMYTNAITTAKIADGVLSINKRLVDFRTQGGSINYSHTNQASNTLDITSIVFTLDPITLGDDLLGSNRLVLFAITGDAVNSPDLSYTTSTSGSVSASGKLTTTFELRRDGTSLTTQTLDARLVTAGLNSSAKLPTTFFNYIDNINASTDHTYEFRVINTRFSTGQVFSYNNLTLTAWIF